MMILILFMNISCKKVPNKYKEGFALLVPLLAISFLAMSSVFILALRVSYLQSAVLRYRHFIEQRYEKSDCEEFKKLYISYDPLYEEGCE